MNELLQMFLEISGKIPITLLYSAIILLISLLLGGVVLWISSGKYKILSLILNLFLSFIRGNPLVVMLFLCYYSFPNFFYQLLRHIGINSKRTAGNPVFILIVAFSIYYATYQKETLKSAIHSVPKEQKELADALAYSKFETYTKVILPQAIYYAIPNIANNLLKIITSLALGFTISVVDIFSQSKISASTNSEYLVSFSMAAIIYWGISIVMDSLVKQFELRRKY